MDRALNFFDGEEYEGKELLLLDNPRAYKWVCTICGILLIPVACDKNKKEEYKRSPHFRVAGQGKTHSCGIDGRDVAVRRGQKKSILKEDGLVFPVYSKLILKNKRKYVSAPEANVAAPASDTYLPKRGRSDSNHDGHNSTAGTICPICKQYADFPKDRGYPLELPGVQGSSYFECFQPGRFIHEGRYCGKKLYVFQISYQRGLEPKQAVNQIVVHSYEHYGPRDNSVYFEIIIDTQAWTEHARSRLWNLVQNTKNEFDIQRGLYPYLFVLGEQDQVLLNRIKCDDIRCVFSMATNYLWPK
ncbi:MAG: hypothetical protein ABIK45_05210 [Pseudomonadota bacterium]